MTLKLFGSPIVTALARSRYITPSGLIIPAILAKCFQEMETRGLEMKGLFRKSGSAIAIKHIQAQFEVTEDPFSLEFSSTISSHAFACLFKRYLQQLAVPVIPHDHQKHFLSVFDENVHCKEALKIKLQEACNKLPREHLHLLKYIIEISHVLGQKKSKNQMTAESLAIIFAPTCIAMEVVTETRSVEHSKKSKSTRPSFNSVPSKLKNHPLVKKARKFFMNTVLKKPQDKLLCASPKDILEHRSVVDSQKWNRIFEFMMTCPEDFATITHPLNTHKDQEKEKEAVPIPMKHKILNPPLVKMAVPKINLDCFVDFSYFDFPATEGFLNKFDEIDIHPTHNDIDTYTTSGEVFDKSEQESDFPHASEEPESTTPYQNASEFTMLDENVFESTTPYQNASEFTMLDEDASEETTPFQNASESTTLYHDTLDKDADFDHDAFDKENTFYHSFLLPPRSKYAMTLQNWKSKVEEDPRVILPTKHINLYL